ncbi:MAG: beta-ketoacyl synthase [Chitinophagales bacterium]|nr:MAG: beta-ketoacyl synthase [Chitinophagales bacterium]
MRPAWVVSDSLIAPLGCTSEENFNAFLSGKTGIRRVHDAKLSSSPVWVAAIDPVMLESQLSESGIPASFTKAESLSILSIQKALVAFPDLMAHKKTAFIFSTTKGNIDHIEKKDPERLNLFFTALKIARYFRHPGNPIVVSNACISGTLALLLAARFLDAGRYDQVVVTGTDILSSFVISGFASLYALSDAPCRPFDQMRKGINLGEAAATIVLSRHRTDTESAAICVRGGAVSNDANHISGPSRTGAELAQAIGEALKQSGLGAAHIGFISAHGTGTRFNDDMESRAFRLAGLQEVPVHSLKGCFGHTLGAAGVVECVMSLWSLRKNVILQSMGFREPGTAEKIHVCRKNTPKEITHFLKTASGFGGCNAALIFSKSDSYV